MPTFAEVGQEIQGERQIVSARLASMLDERILGLALGEIKLGLMSEI